VFCPLSHDPHIRIVRCSVMFLTLLGPLFALFLVLVVLLPPNPALGIQLGQENGVQEQVISAYGVDGFYGFGATGFSSARIPAGTEEV
jgi:hypothetical protein